MTVMLFSKKKKIINRRSLFRRLSLHFELSMRGNIKFVNLKTCALNDCNFYMPQPFNALFKQLNEY